MTSLSSAAESKRKAVVIFSGGQDSTTCLYWALEKFDQVEAITFDYGQRHRVEIECARSLCESLGLAWNLIPINSLSALSSNALTDSTVPVNNSGGLNGLPSTFVPGRNALFLTLAAAYAVPKNIPHLVIGACQTDFSGYPDCRDVFIESMQESLSLAMDFDLVVHRPLMHLTKAQTFELAARLGKLNEVIEHSHTCYEGARTQRHSWGYGCGVCPACELRKKGYQEFLASRGN